MDVELNRDAKQIVGDWLINLNAALRAKDARQIAALTWTIETVCDREPVARHLYRELEHTRIDDHD